MWSGVLLGHWQWLSCSRNAVMLWKRSVLHRTLVYMLNSWNSIHTSIPSLRLNFNSKRTRNPENYRSVSLLELYTQICAFVSLSLLHFHSFKSVKQYSATRRRMKCFTESYYAPYFDLQSPHTSVATLYKNQVSTVGLWDAVLKKNRRKTRRDRIRNKIIRETVGIQSVQEYVERFQLRWYGHVNRMDDKRIVKSVWSKRNRKEAKGTIKENMEGRVTRGDKERKE